VLVACVLAVAAMFTTASRAQVVINEIHYHPADPNPNAEFIELYNAGSTSEDISGWYLDAFPIPFVFPTIPPIPVGGYVVVAKDTALLLSLTDVSTPYQWPSGDLNNGGELIQLLDDGLVVQDEVDYLDNWPWPSEPDGGGPSLELLNSDFDNSYASVWRASIVPQRVQRGPGGLGGNAGETIGRDRSQHGNGDVLRARHRRGGR
jgi:hypothetical protein